MITFSHAALIKLTARESPASVLLQNKAQVDSPGVEWRRQAWLAAGGIVLEPGVLPWAYMSAAAASTLARGLTSSQNRVAFCSIQYTQARLSNCASSHLPAPRFFANPRERNGVTTNGTREFKKDSSDYTCPPEAGLSLWQQCCITSSKGSMLINLLVATYNKHILTNSERSGRLRDLCRLFEVIHFAMQFFCQVHNYFLSSKMLQVF